MAFEKKFAVLIFVFAAVFIFSSAGRGLAFEKELRDGIYEGGDKKGMVKVEVVVEDGEVDQVAIIHHGGGGVKYEEMIRPLTKEVIEKQSLELDAVSGATVSSYAFVEAAGNALSDAEVK